MKSLGGEERLTPGGMTASKWEIDLGTPLPVCITTPSTTLQDCILNNIKLLYSPSIETRPEKVEIQNEEKKNLNLVVTPVVGQTSKLIIKIDPLKPGQYILYVPKNIFDPKNEESDKMIFISEHPKQIPMNYITSEEPLKQNKISFAVTEESDSYILKGQRTRCVAVMKRKSNELEDIRRDFVKMEPNEFWTLETNAVGNQKRTYLYYVKEVQGTDKVVFECMYQGQYEVFCANSAYSNLHPVVSKPTRVPNGPFEKLPIVDAFNTVNEYEKEVMGREWIAQCNQKLQESGSGTISRSEFLRWIQKKPFGSADTKITDELTREVWVDRILREMVEKPEKYQIKFESLQKITIFQMFAMISKDKSFFRRSDLVDFLGVEEKHVMKFFVECDGGDGNEGYSDGATIYGATKYDDIKTCADLVDVKNFNNFFEGAKAIKILLESTTQRDNEQFTFMKEALARANCGDVFNFLYVDHLNTIGKPQNPIDIRVGGISASTFLEKNKEELYLVCYAEETTERKDLVKKHFKQFIDQDMLKHSFIHKIQPGEDTIEGSILVLEPEEKPYCVICAVVKEVSSNRYFRTSTLTMFKHIKEIPKSKMLESLNIREKNKFSTDKKAKIRSGILKISGCQVADGTVIHSEKSKTFYFISFGEKEHEFVVSDCNPEATTYEIASLSSYRKEYFCAIPKKLFTTVDKYLVFTNNPHSFSIYVSNDVCNSISDPLHYFGAEVIGNDDLMELLGLSKLRQFEEEVEGEDGNRQTCKPFSLDTLDIC